jgi:hypothetical protein
MEKLREVLRKALAVRSSDPKCALTEYGGNFRYKKVQVNGLDQPLDIDLSFMSKSERITYSTDMCVRERLDELKKSDPEGYKYTIANIVLAKRVLKEHGLYKKYGSDGATQYGGFGGVGVENWILQNGGSFSKAIETFLEAAKKAKSFSEFQEIYPIFDFGQNHMAREYSHDSFIRGLTPSGYDRMQEVFLEIQKALVPEEKRAESTELSASMMDGMDQIARQSRSGRVLEVSQELKTAVSERGPVEQQTKE